MNVAIKKKREDVASTRKPPKTPPLPGPSIPLPPQKVLSLVEGELHFSPLSCFRMVTKGDENEWCEGVPSGPNSLGRLRS